MRSGASSRWFEGDGVAELLEFGDESSGGAFGDEVLEVVAAEFAVGLAGAEHVPVGGQDGVFDGAERAAVPDPGAKPLVLGLEVAAFHAGSGERGFFERDPEPFGAFAGPSGAALAGGTVVAGTLSCPRGEVPGGGEHGHVGPDLSDHYLGGAAGDAGESARELDARERAELFLDRLG